MKLYSIIIVDVFSGVPVFSYNTSGENGTDTKDVLFSGAMVAIQKLMEEFDGGKLQKIETEQFDLLGVLGKRFVIFAIGEITTEIIVKNHLDMLLLYLENEVFPELLVKLDKNVINLLTAMIDQFIELGQDKDISAYTYRLNRRLGFQGLSHHHESKFDNFMIGYLTSLDKKYLEINHRFLLKYSENEYLLGFIYSRDVPIAQIFRIRNSSIQKISSNLHEFTFHTNEFITNYAELIINYDVDEKDEVITNFNATLCNKIGNIFHNYSLDLDFLGIGNILQAFDKSVNKILGGLMIGKSLIVIAEDEDFAKPILDTFVYITGISNVDMSINNTIQARLTWSTDVNSDIDTNTMILDLGDIKFLGGQNSNYFKKLWNSINETQSNNKLKLYEMRNLCIDLWNDAAYILEHCLTDPYEEVLQKRGLFKEKIEILRLMLNWLNPHFSENTQLKSITNISDNLW